ncbi:MAG: rod-binding protein [Wujia sp.]
MDSVGTLSSTDYSTYVNQSMTAGLTNSLSGVNSSTATDDEMMEACKEFETYMVEQVYKSMEKTIIKADEEENDYEKYFGDYRIQEYAKMVTEQGKLGLAQQLYEAMIRKRDAVAIVDASDEVAGATPTDTTDASSTYADSASSVNATGETAQ